MAAPNNPEVTAKRASLRLLIPESGGGEVKRRKWLEPRLKTDLLLAAGNVGPPLTRPHESLCYIVYVVLLEKAPGELPFSLYVGGASGWTTTADAEGRYHCRWQEGPARRYRDHRDGWKASRWVRKYGVGLLPDLYEHLNPTSYWKLSALEAELAEALRVARIEVHQN